MENEKPRTLALLPIAAYPKHKAKAQAATSGVRVVVSYSNNKKVEGALNNIKKNLYICTEIIY